MALTLKDRVLETTTTSGTGTISLGGTTTGYQAFSVVGDGNTTYYTIQGVDGSGNPTGEWEVGTGTYTAAGNTLSRDSVFDSSNGGAKVAFSSGTKQVFCDLPAEAVSTGGGGANFPVNTNITSMTGVTGSISSPTYVKFDTTYATTLGVGQLGWDGHNTLGLGMTGGNVVQHIGEDSFYYIKASSAITKGQVIMFTGAVGASGVLTAAPATGVATGQYIMGIASESIALNGFGLIQWFGEVTNINTSGYADGDVLYYDSSVTGGFTKTFPTSGPIVVVAAVTNGGSAGGGSVFVRVGAIERLTAGTGVSVSQSLTSTTITNTAPDQTVSLTGGTGISTSGTYPNFTVTNTAPDQVVSLTGAGTTTVTGTYPSFTITSTGGAGGGDVSGPASAVNSNFAAFDGTTGKLIKDSGFSSSSFQAAGTYVTSVTGTSPVVSSGGTTPAISMPAANTTTSGYLTSTDWNTFNSKGSGTVTSVGITAGTGINVSGSPITGSGSITVTNSAPDQVVSLTAGANVTITGTYPSFTIASSGGGGGGSPAGANTQVQYNNSGAFGASATYTFDGTTVKSPNVETTGGVLADGAFGGTYVDGIVVDYSAGNGRISVGGSDSLTFYNGGIGTNALGSVTSGGDWDFNGNITVGTGTPVGGATNPLSAVASAANQYIQSYIVNNTNGTSSSSDFTCYPHNGSDASGWIDMGITSATYSDASYTVTGGNEGYILMSAPSGSSTTGSLVIATDSTGTANDIQFYTGGFAQGKTTPKLIIKGTTGNVGIEVASPTAALHLPAGTATASTAPLKLTAGTNLTTAEAGAVEYSGVGFFTTGSSASGRGIVLAPHTVRVNTARTKATNNTTLEAVFDAANDTLALAANTLYHFKGVYVMSTSASATAGGITMGFTFSNAQQEIGYRTLAHTQTSATAQTTLYTTVATAVTVTATATTAANYVIEFEGWFKSNATTGGTVIPAFAQSVVGTTVAPTASANSWIMITPMSSSVTATLIAGNWS